MEDQKLQTTMYVCIVPRYAFEILSQPNSHQQYHIVRWIIDRSKWQRDTDMASGALLCHASCYGKMTSDYVMAVALPALEECRMSLDFVILVNFSHSLRGYSPCLPFSHRFVPHSDYPVWFEAEWLPLNSSTDPSMSFFLFLIFFPHSESWICF